MRRFLGIFRNWKGFCGGVGDFGRVVEIRERERGIVCVGVLILVFFLGWCGLGNIYCISK